MKRWMIMATTAILVCLNINTGSAATKPLPIQVLLNGQALAFPTAPTANNGKTFVEFRTLFHALGYKVDYVAATKTVKAKSAERMIEMKIGGTSALVNGNKVLVNGEMKAVNGRTLVGARFIAALSDKKVHWNAAKRTVEITDKAPTAQQQAAVFSVLDQLAAAENNQDTDTYLTFFGTVAREAVEPGIREQFARFHTQTIYTAMELESYSAAQAVVVTSEETRKVDGEGFFADYGSDYRCTLSKSSAGQWEITEIEQLWFEVLDEESMWNQEVEVAGADQTAIEAVLSSQMQAINDENIEAYRATYVPNAPGLEQDIAHMQSLMQAVDMRMMVKRMAIVEYGNGQAKLLVSAVLESVTGTEFPTYRSVTEFGLVQQDGKWLFADADNEVEYISEILE